MHTFHEPKSILAVVLFLGSLLAFCPHVAHKSVCSTLGFSNHVGHSPRLVDAMCGHGFERHDEEHCQFDEGHDHDFLLVRPLKVPSPPLLATRTCANRLMLATRWSHGIPRRASLFICPPSVLEMETVRLLT